MGVTHEERWMGRESLRVFYCEQVRGRARRLVPV